MCVCVTLQSGDERGSPRPHSVLDLTEVTADWVRFIVVLWLGRIARMLVFVSVSAGVQQRIHAPRAVLPPCASDSPNRPHQLLGVG